ncbi:MAG: leucine-rich repeat domain-containing protein, partial [Lachnospiraceae bacterium]|nr:leucine-rich repeat domain-containing protein [Lachnospiraceae bacterium]
MKRKWLALVLSCTMCLLSVNTPVLSVSASELLTTEDVMEVADEIIEMEETETGDYANSESAQISNDEFIMAVDDAEIADDASEDSSEDSYDGDSEEISGADLKEEKEESESEMGSDSALEAGLESEIVTDMETEGSTEEFVVSIEESTENEEETESEELFENEEETENSDIVASGYSDSLYWVLDTEGTLTVTGNGSMKNYNGQYMKGEDWHAYSASIYKAIISEGITSIGDYAFYNCASLQNIEISSTVLSIGEKSFESCTALESVQLPSELCSIGSGAFHGCGSLQTITLPESVTTIEGSTFGNCHSLESVNFHENIVCIGAYAFSDCSSLRELVIPESVESIDKHAFESCTALTSVTISDGVESIGEYAFYECSSLTDLHILGTTVAIGTRAFAYCTSLETVTIPLNSDLIGSEAFFYSGLKTIILSGDVTSFNHSRTSSPFLLSSIENVYVEEENEVYTSIDGVLYSKDKTTLAFCGGGRDEISIADGTIIIEEDAFSGWNVTNSPDHVFIPASVMSISDSEFLYPFAYYTSSVTLMGYKDSYIEQYAEDNGFPFKAVDVLLAEGICGEDMTWTLTESGELEISGSGTMSDYQSGTAPWYSYCGEIYNVIINEGVESIGAYAFYNCSMYKISIAESVQRIGSYAFRYTNYKSGMKTVVIPSGVTEIDDYAFYYSFLSEIEFSEGLKTIGDSAFYFCQKLEKVVLPESLESIGKNAFSSCTSLKHVECSGGITYIDDSVFSGCTPLSYVLIPSSVASISDNAFEGCDSLVIYCDKYSTAYLYAIQNEIEFVEIGVVELCGICGDGVNWTLDTSDHLTIYGTGAMDDYSTSNWVPWYMVASEIRSVTIEEGVTHIGDHAFGLFGVVEGAYKWCWNCENIESVSIADSVCSIGNSAFYSCSGITELTLSDNVVNIGAYAFYGLYQLTELVVPGNLQQIEEGAFYSCSGLEKVTIKEGVTYIGSSAFAFCTSLTELVLPESVTEIGEYAFTDNYALQSISIPDGVTKIGIEAFSMCESLTEITIPGSVETIEGYLFAYCRKLTSVTFTKGTTCIESNVFEECSQLTQLTIPGTVTEFDADFLYGCSNLQTIIGTDGYTSLDGVLFNGEQTELLLYPSGKVGKYEIPDGVTRIGDSAFANAVGLTQIIFSDSVTEVGNWAFNNCGNLYDAQLSESVGTIGMGAFLNCPYLSEISIPDSVSVIGKCAFGFEGDTGNVEYWSYLLNKISDFTISGYDNSPAKTYAEENDFTFVSLGDHQHRYAVSSRVEPTCTEDGVEIQACTVCGAEIRETLPMTGHSFPEEWTVQTEATCTASGLTYRVCMNAGCTELEQEVIPATGHDYEGQEEIRVEATDTVSGEIYHLCKNCGEKEVLEILIPEKQQELITAAQELLEDEASDADELVSAVVQIENQVLIDADSVDLVVGVEERLLGEDKIGETQYSGDTTNNVAVEGAGVTVAATVLTEDSGLDADEIYSAQLDVSEVSDEGTLEICLHIIDSSGAVVVENQELAAPVSITIPVPDKYWAGTFTFYHDVDDEKVYLNFEMDEDSQTITFMVPSLSPFGFELVSCMEGNHDLQESRVIVEPDCTNPGFRELKCNNCAYTEQEMIAATGHSMTKHEKVAATCTEDGVAEYYECENCGLYFSDKAGTDLLSDDDLIIAATGHSLTKHEEVFATCTLEGTIEYYSCENCGLLYEDADASIVLQEADLVVAATGHTAGEWMTTKAATCTETGEQVQKCTVC